MVGVSWIPGCPAGVRQSDPVGARAQHTDSTRLHSRLLEIGFEFAYPDEALAFARPDGL
jgi:hypothetical protein